MNEKVPKYFSFCAFRYQQPFRIHESSGDGMDDDDYFVGSRTAPLLVTPAITAINQELDETSEEEEEDEMITGPIGMTAIKALKDKDETMTPLMSFIMASIAGILASIFTHPFDVVRTQMQLWTYKPKGYQQNPSLVPNNEPSISLLPHGTSIQEIMAISNKVESNRFLIETTSAVPTITSSSNQQLNHYVSKPPKPPQRPIPRGAQCTPQNNDPGLHRTGVIRFTYNLISTEGYPVFWRGLIPRLARRTIATALAWTMFEELNQRFVQRFTNTGFQDPTIIRRD